jgi:hypothetical protein
VVGSIFVVVVTTSSSFVPLLVVLLRTLLLSPPALCFKSCHEATAMMQHNMNRTEASAMAAEQRQNAASTKSKTHKERRFQVSSNKRLLFVQTKGRSDNHSGRKAMPEREKWVAEWQVCHSHR